MRFCTVFVIMVFLLVGCKQSPGLAPSSYPSAGFVKTSGPHFLSNGKPFFVVGTNNHYLGWATRAEVDSILQFAKNSHYNVVRTILHSVIGSLDGSKETIWNWQNNADVSNMGMRGVYLLYWDTAKDTWAINDSSETGLGRWDYVIWKAGQLELKIDPNHLVTTGSEGFYDGVSIGSDPDSEPFKAPAIDFQVWHVYTNYHNIPPQGVIALINRHCASAEKGDKPVLLQEFGMPAATPAEKLARRDIYRSWLTAIYINPDCAGWLYWRLEGKVKLAPTTTFPAAENDPGQTPDGWPPDNGETFSIYPETSPDASFYDPSYQMFKEEAARFSAKNK